MSEILALDRVGLKADGHTLTMSLSAGQSLAIVGPGGAGKSRFLRVLLGQERPAQGTASLRGEVATPAPLPKKLRVQGLSRQYPESASVLAAASLLDDDRLLVGGLTPSQAAAAELVPTLSQKAGVVAIDGHLDRLDPWALPAVVERLRRLSTSGVAWVATTNRPELLRIFDFVVVLVRQEVRFAGTPRDLLKLGSPHTLSVETRDQERVRALTTPFEVTFEETEEGIRMQAAAGQDLAARLLLEGYGDVRFVVHRPPTYEEALRTIR